MLIESACEGIHFLCKYWSQIDITWNHSFYLENLPNTYHRINVNDKLINLCKYSLEQTSDKSKRFLRFQLWYQVDWHLNWTLPTTVCLYLSFDFQNKYKFSKEHSRIWNFSLKINCLQFYFTFNLGFFLIMCNALMWHTADESPFKLRFLWNSTHYIYSK